MFEIGYLKERPLLEYQFKLHRLLTRVLALMLALGSEMCLKVNI